MQAILAMLAGGDRRSIGRADEVAALVEAEPGLLPTLIAAMSDPDPLIRMRSADAAEKVTLHHPEWLQPHKAALLSELPKIDQAEVRWHLALMLPRLALAEVEQQRVFALLTGCLGDASSIVRTCALQGLYDLAAKYPIWRPDAAQLIARHAAAGTSAMKARARKLLASLDAGQAIRSAKVRRASASSAG